MADLDKIQTRITQTDHITYLENNAFTTFFICCFELLQCTKLQCAMNMECLSYLKYNVRWYLRISKGSRYFFQ